MVEDIKVEAMKVIYGEDKAQIEKIVISPAIVGSNLAGKYFNTYTAAGVKYTFWFNTGSDVAPVVPGTTLVEVSILAGDTYSQIASKLAPEMVIALVYSAAASGGNVTLTHLVDGYASAAHDAKQALKKVNFGFSVIEQGDLAEDIGCIQGNIEVAMEQSFIDVTCHAEGVTPIAQLKNGVSNLEVTLNLQETTKEKMKTMFVKSGGSFTPEGGEEVFGMGTYKNFENMFKFASKLVLHPVRLLDGDKSDDWQFHKAMPLLTSAVFSGEEVFALPLTFRVYPAKDIDSRVNYFSIGDGSQDLA